jgi:hypothetical protein
MVTVMLLDMRAGESGYTGGQEAGLPLDVKCKVGVEGMLH